MQYWINQNGVQSGPVTREELEKMDVSADAYVWRSGLDDWVKITSLSELDGVVGADAPAAAQSEPAPQPQPQLQQSEAEGQSGTLPAAAQAVDSQESPAPQPAVGAVQMPVQQYYYGQPQYAAAPQYAAPKCPPTNLAWSIICTILCCTIPGIVAIFYAMKVSRRYREGDYEGAMRASETGAWWCIGSIIAGLAISPLISAIRMLL